MSEGCVVVCARFRSSLALLRRGRCKRCTFRRSLKTEHENEGMKDYNLRPSTVYVPTGSCPGKFARRQPHNFKYKVPVQIQTIIKINCTHCSHYHLRRNPQFLPVHCTVLFATHYRLMYKPDHPAKYNNDSPSPKIRPRIVTWWVVIWMNWLYPPLVCPV